MLSLLLHSLGTTAAATYTGWCHSHWLTRCRHFLRQTFHIHASFEVFPDLEPGGCWVQQIADNLLVDFQEGAFAQEACLLAFPLGQNTDISQHWVHGAADCHCGKLRRGLGIVSGFPVWNLALDCSYGVQWLGLNVQQLARGKQSAVQHDWSASRHCQ